MTQPVGKSWNIRAIPVSWKNSNAVYIRCNYAVLFLPPAYVVRREGNVLTRVCPSTNLSVHREGGSVLSPAWGGGSGPGGVGGSGPAGWGGSVLSPARGAQVQLGGVRSSQGGSGPAGQGGVRSSREGGVRSSQGGSGPAGGGQSSQGGVSQDRTTE